MGNSTRIRETIERSLRIPVSCETCSKCDVVINVPDNDFESDYKTYYCNIGKFRSYENKVCDFHIKKEVTD